MRIICLLLGGPERRIRDERGRTWLFEDHSYCGPAVIGRRSGDPISKQPSERSPFWRAVSLWARQGKRVRGDVAVWHEPPPLRVKHVGGQDYLVLPDQAEGVDYELSRQEIVVDGHGLRRRDG